MRGDRVDAKDSAAPRGKACLERRVCGSVSDGCLQVGHWKIEAAAAAVPENKMEGGGH